MQVLRSFLAVACLLLLGVAGASAADEWQRIHGQVQSVSGNTVTFKADDGRVLTVDATQVSSEIRSALKPNAGATVIGKAGASNDQFVAQYIQQDASDPSRGGTIVGQTPTSQTPSASPTSVDEQAWQRIHGTVSSVSGTTLSLKADDGRNLNVDTKEVSDEIRRSLNGGDKVTVVGFYRGDQNNVAARYVEKESSNK